MCLLSAAVLALHCLGLGWPSSVVLSSSCHRVQCAGGVCTLLHTRAASCKPTVAVLCKRLGGEGRESQVEERLCLSLAAASNSDQHYLITLSSALGFHTSTRQLDLMLHLKVTYSRARRKYPQ